MPPSVSCVSSATTLDEILNLAYAERASELVFNTHECLIQCRGQLFPVEIPSDQVPGLMLALKTRFEISDNEDITNILKELSFVLADKPFRARFVRIPPRSFVVEIIIVFFEY